MERMSVWLRFDGWINSIILKIGKQRTILKLHDHISLEKLFSTSNLYDVKVLQIASVQLTSKPNMENIKIPPYM